MKKRVISLVLAMALSMSMLMFVGCNGFDLSKYKEQKKTEIETYATSKGEENYYEAEWQDILSIVESAKTEIDLAEEKSTVDTILSLAKEEINKAKQISQIIDKKLNYSVGFAKEGNNYNLDKTEKLITTFEEWEAFCLERRFEYEVENLGFIVKVYGEEITPKYDENYFIDKVLVVYENRIFRTGGEVSIKDIYLNGNVLAMVLECTTGLAESEGSRLAIAEINRADILNAKNNVVIDKVEVTVE